MKRYVNMKVKDWLKRRVWVHGETDFSKQTFPNGWNDYDKEDAKKLWNWYVSHYVDFISGKNREFYQN